MRTAYIFFLTLSVAWSQMTGRDIMQKVDDQPEPRSMIANTVMTLIAEKRGRIKERVREIVRYQRNYSTGEFSSKSLIRFLQPADVKGTGFLMWEYRDNRDDDQWLFLPALGKVKRIAAREKSENFMGSDFSYEDIGGRELEEDTFELLGEETLDGVRCYQVKAVPVAKGTSYSHRICWVTRDSWRLKKVEFYDQRRELLKVLTIVRERFDNPYWTVQEMTMVNVQDQHTTRMVISGVQYDTGISDAYFTERFLMRVE